MYSPYRTNKDFSSSNKWVIVAQITQILKFGYVQYMGHRVKKVAKITHKFHFHPLQ